MAQKVDFVADFKPVQMGHKDVLDKDLFIEAIRLIQNQSEKMRKFDFALDEALRMVCDGAIYVDLNNEYYAAALLLLEKGMHDRANTITRMRISWQEWRKRKSLMQRHLDRI